jgi:NAD(P)-dependent dehydrogenase (short-subunit alcohol dehydrogenase family)
LIVALNNMARIFITGSGDGLGLLAAKQLVKEGHEVVIHTRNAVRGEQALQNVADAKDVLIADLSNIAETKALAEKANALGTFEAVIHNAGVYQTGAQQLLQVNMLAPYMLTCLMHKPERLVS